MRRAVIEVQRYMTGAFTQDRDGSASDPFDASGGYFEIVQELGIIYDDSIRSSVEEELAAVSVDDEAMRESRKHVRGIGRSTDGDSLGMSFVIVDDSVDEGKLAMSVQRVAVDQRMRVAWEGMNRRGVKSGKGSKEEEGPVARRSLTRAISESNGFELLLGHRRALLNRDADGREAHVGSA